MTYSQGSLVLVPFPFTDLSGTKKRPAVVVSPDWFNQSYEDIILAAVTSNVPPSPQPPEVPLTQADLAFGVMQKESVVKVGKLFTCHRDIVKQFAEVSTDKLSEVLGTLRQLFT